ncbi:MAG: hypothetical protein HQL59_12610 [Magnetococcales bacterium]|nr:hypothetical protein [Magnetococcales bacterium]
MAPDHESRTLSFHGGPLTGFGKTLVLVLSCFLVIPIAWALAAFMRWFANSVKSSDGTTLAFEGRGGRIWWLPLVWILPSIVSSAVPLLHNELGYYVSQSPGNSFFWGLIVGWVLLPLSSFATLVFWRWVVDGMVPGCGTRFAFKGSYLGVLAWSFIVGLSMLTIVGWAWVSVAMYRWYWRNVEGGGSRLNFTGSGWQMLWRTIAFTLASVLIVPIPWAQNWYLGWYVRCSEIVRAD